MKEFPKIFLKEALPLTCGFALELEDVGSSGNKEVGSFGEFFRLSVCNISVGGVLVPRRVVGELLVHGVFRDPPC